MESQFDEHLKICKLVCGPVCKWLIALQRTRNRKGFFIRVPCFQFKELLRALRWKDHLKMWSAEIQTRDRWVRSANATSLLGSPQGIENYLSLNLLDAKRKSQIFNDWIDCNDCYKEQLLSTSRT